MSSIEQQNAAVQQECGACGAEAGEECAPLCLGVAAAQDEPWCNHDAVAVVNGWCECGVYVGIAR